LSGKKGKWGSSVVLYRALLKYGYSNFSLDILEYCEPNVKISREQYYIDLLKPEYNILKKAGSNLGFKHSEETKLIMSINSKRASTVKINDISTNDTKVFRSNVQAGKYLGVSAQTIRNFKKSGRVYKIQIFNISFLVILKLIRALVMIINRCLYGYFILVVD
jgi:hypothetical protein